AVGCENKSGATATQTPCREHASTSILSCPFKAAPTTLSLVHCFRKASSILSGRNTNNPSASEASFTSFSSGQLSIELFTHISVSAASNACTCSSMRWVTTTLFREVISLICRHRDVLLTQVRYAMFPPIDANHNSHCRMVCNCRRRLGLDEIRSP